MPFRRGRVCTRQNTSFARSPENRALGPEKLIEIIWNETTGKSIKKALKFCKYETPRGMAFPVCGLCAAFLYRKIRKVPRVLPGTGMSAGICGCEAAPRILKKAGGVGMLELKDSAPPSPAPRAPFGAFPRAIPRRESCRAPRLRQCSDERSDYSSETQSRSNSGALDSTTSIQIMDLIKEVAKDKLVIMVTHNPELADQYADRIIRFSDGKIIDDSHPHAERPKEDQFRLKNAALWQRRNPQAARLSYPHTHPCLSRGHAIFRIPACTPPY